MAPYRIDNDSCEDCASNSLAILGIVVTPDKLLMATPVQTSDDTENDDRKHGYDGAVYDCNLARRDSTGQEIGDRARPLCRGEMECLGQHTMTTHS